MTGTARQVAFSALMRVERDSAYSNLILDKLLSESELSVRDKSFAAMLFYGVIEKKLLLDYNLARISDKPINKLDMEVLMILRMGLYQIFFAESVPDSAAVNESVKLCKANQFNSASSFVNGVLRTAVKLGSLQLPDKRKGKNKYLSVKYSCPETIIRLWRNAYGDEITISILESLDGRPPLTAAVNTLKTNTHKLLEKLKNSGVNAEISPILDDCIVIGGAGSPASLAEYREGLFHIQDAASHICCKILGAQPGETVIDACSAPGGKTFTLSEMMQNKGRLVSCDLYENRLKLVKNGAQRLGITIIETHAGDSAENNMLPEADRILCDVPCSGLGIIRRKPELRYKEDTGTETLPELQYEILENCSRFLKKGGVLVYSTCTLNPAENNGVIERFLREHSDFRPNSVCIPEKVKRTIDEPDNELTLFPQKNGTDGFFIASVQRI